MKATMHPHAKLARGLQRPKVGMVDGAGASKWKRDGNTPKTADQIRRTAQQGNII